MPAPPPVAEERPLPEAAGRSGALPRTGTMVPPLLPVLLPLVLAAIVTGVLFAWLFPPTPSGRVAPTPRFVDITAESGLAALPPPATGPDEPTTLGGGVVCFDYDGDGHSDLFLVHGAPWPWEEPFAKRISRGSCTLLHNDGGARFSDVTAIAGLNVELQGMTAVAGDFDNDGRTDLYVTCVGPNHLFRNRGQGRFEDVTEAAGVGGEDNTWSTGAAWIDYDNDGRLDLVVAHYARWPVDVDLQAAFMVSKLGHSYGAPAGFLGAFPSLYRNLGDGRFALVPTGAGLRDIDPQTRFPMAKTLAVIPVDANGDGRIDLLFTYLTGESSLFLNQGSGQFRRWASGTDFRQEGISAGLASASSLPFVQPGGADTRFPTLQSALAGQGRTRREGVARLPAKGGVAVLDYDLDGRLEVFSAGGLAEPDTEKFDEVRNFGAPPEFLWNRGGEWVAAAPPAGGEAWAWAQPLTARGVATADFDGDGDPDVVLAQNGAGPRLLRNDQRSGLPWLAIDLVATRGCREAAGARVQVHTPRRVFTQIMVPAIGYMAQSASTLTFGLGDDARVRRIVVQWPSGARQELRAPGINRRLVITEP